MVEVFRGIVRQSPFLFDDQGSVLDYGVRCIDTPEKGGQIDEGFKGRARCVGVGSPVELVFPEVSDTAYQGDNRAVLDRYRHQGTLAHSFGRFGNSFVENLFAQFLGDRVEVGVDM